MKNEVKSVAPKMALFSLLPCAILLGMCSGIAIAQEAEQRPGDALVRNLCGVGPDIAAWLIDAKGIPTANLSQRSRDELGTVARSLGSLCADAADLDGPGMKRGFWLLRADALGERLIGELSRILESPQTAASRTRLQKLTVSISYLQGTLGLLRSIYSYTKVEVREVTKEVIRTVEVPAQCQAPPDPRAECNQTLRQAVRRWYGMATDILGPYGENGRANDAFTVVVQVRREMNQLPSDADMLSVAVSWSQRLHRAANDPTNVKRDGGMWDYFQLSESEQSRIESLAQDIESQLWLCHR